MDKTQAKCKRCEKVIELSNVGIQALKSRAAGKKHQDITQKVSMIFETVKPVSNSDQVLTRPSTKPLTKPSN